MASQYTNVTRAEMETFLVEYRQGKAIDTTGGFRRIRPPRYVQAVYGIVVEYFGCKLSLRIKTGIEPDGNSPDVGEEAMHVELWWREAEGVEPIRVGKSKRVHRVAGWRDNLRNRLDNWSDAAPMICAVCRRPMAERKGPKGNFMGCLGWKKDGTGCKNTAQVPAPQPCSISRRELEGEGEIQDIEGGQM
jgi:hypothetical protein